MIFLRKKTVEKINKSTNFAARAAVCYFLILLMLLSCILRVAVIDSKGYAAVCTEQSKYKLKIKKMRGTIYDCNMLPLTNNKKSMVAAALSTPRAAIAISGIIDEEDRGRVMESLKKNKLTACKVNKKTDCEGVAVCDVLTTSDTVDVCHVVGYLDSSGHGAAGLAAAYDDLLYSDDYLCAIAETDGKGNILGGSQPYFENKSLALANGVVSTIDINIQKAVCSAVGEIKKGAVVVSEVKTGRIKAMVSLPQFDAQNLQNYLESEDSPFINRALSAYSVGSVFKSLVAAAGIENGKGEYNYYCTGSTFVIDRDFKCHKLEGHGTVDLRQALAFSCNCFFYNYAFLLGGEIIYKTARVLNFGASIKIADNMKSSKGALPDVDLLSNQANLANFSIGQGELSASPVALLPLYTAIANGGKYYLPSLVIKTINNGVSYEYDKGNMTKAMSKTTADLLKSYLVDVITEGTATAAAPKTVTAAGKTATAQTGRVDDNGEKINNSWFCGFFPAEEPEYVVVVLSEGGKTSETTAAFSKIADRITEITKKQPLTE